jgi:hypothetical protein
MLSRNISYLEEEGMYSKKVGEIEESYNNLLNIHKNK